MINRFSKGTNIPLSGSKFPRLVLFLTSASLIFASSPSLQAQDTPDYFKQNCMNCHNAEGDGEGIFSAAGSVYDTTQIAPFPNAKVILYTGANGSGNVVKNIEVDAYGNFYTTESISFENDLFVSVLNPNGTETFMNSPVVNGECNSCHGSSSVRIFVP